MAALAPGRCVRELDGWPCGYFGDPLRECTCSPSTVTRYQRRISGPLLDRIDIHAEVRRVDFDKLSDQRLGEPSSAIRPRVEAARDRQRVRLGGPGLTCNADMGPAEVRQFCLLDDPGRALVRQAMSQLQLSARAFHCILKLAHTIADLAGEDRIATAHLAEALQHRPWRWARGGVSMADTVQLPPPRLKGDMSLEEAIWRRRSVRSYREERLADDVLGQLLWSAQGVVERGDKLRRTVPSAGARYPLETYVATSGYLGHYQPAKHALRVLRRADVRPDLERAALGQEFIHQASAVIILTCIARRIEERYGKSRGARYIAMEAGHAAQNVMLQAVALGLASVPIGAFQDAQLGKILELGPEERALYMLAVGRAG